VQQQDPICGCELLSSGCKPVIGNNAPVFREQEAKSTSHRPPPGRIVTDRKSGNIEWQIESNDRASQVIAKSEEDLLDPFRPSQKFQPVCAGVACKHLLIMLAQGLWIVKQPILFEPIAVTKLE
jgi:hypothetical protein